MALLNQTFDATQVDPQQPFEVIPAGKYVAQIIDSEMRGNKAGTGSYLWLELEIIEGEYTGRKLWDRLNIDNPNPQAVEIALRTLSAIGHATGQLAFSDSEALHFRPMLVTVRLRPAANGYDASNEIRGYQPADGAAAAPSAPATPKPAAAPKAAAPAPAPAAAPWKRAKAG